MKSKKFRIPKVPRVLEPLKSNAKVTRLATAVSSRKNTQNGNKSRFAGATCIFSKCCDRQKQQEMVKSTARFGAPKIELRPF